MKAPAYSKSDEAVYATVSYADVFDMPIGLGHLHRCVIGVSLSLLETSMAVDNLVSRNRLGRRGDLVYLAGRENVCGIHDERATRARAVWVDVERWGQRIGRIPLVRMVAVMGPHALDNATERDDIDLFVVVRPRRLWLARRLINNLCRHAARQGVALSPNYIVSTRALALDERSVLLALELAQMVVIVGDEVCRSVRRNNGWMRDLLPNTSVEGDRTHLSAIAPTRKQRWIEWGLLLPPFRIIETWERRRGLAQLRRSASGRGGVDSPGTALCSAEVYRGHVAGTAAEVEAAWKQRLGEG